MKTTQNISSKILRCLPKRFLTAHSVRGLVAAVATFLGVASATGQYVYSVNIVGCVPDMTFELLTAPLTNPERQALHAENFNNLPIAARPVYLHSVAFAVGYTVASNGHVPEPAMLVNHLKNVIMTGIYDVPAVPPEDSENLAEFLSVVHTEMRELNLLISTQVANNTSYQQAMYAGAVDSFWPGEIGWPW